MKKKIIFLAVVLFSFLGLSCYTAFASEGLENEILFNPGYDNESAYFRCYPGTMSFTCVKGLSDEKSYIIQDADFDLHDLGPFSLCYKYPLVIKTNKNGVENILTNYSLHLTVGGDLVDKSSLYSIVLYDETKDVKVNDVYRAIFYNGDDKFDNELFDFTSVFGAGAVVTEVKAPEEIENQFDTVDTNIILNIGLSLLYCVNYHAYPTVRHLYTEYKRALPLDTIIDNALITDNVDGRITNYEYKMIDNYEPSTAKIGTYIFYLIVKDSSGNISSQRCDLHVVDVKAPICNKLSADIYINKELDAKFLIKNYDITDDTEIKSIVVKNMDEYKSLNNRHGSISLELELTDIYNNSEVYTVNLNIIDNIPPSVLIINEYKVSSSRRISYDDIKKLVFVNENSSHYFIEVKDLDDYLNHYDVIGKYHFNVIVRDNNPSNTVTKDIIICVVDNDPPIIDLSNISIVISDDKEVNRDDIISIISKYTNEEVIEADYSFDVENSCYSVTYTNSAGVTKNAKIIVKENKKEENNSSINYPLIIIISCLGLLLLLGSWFFIRALSKRH